MAEKRSEAMPRSSGGESIRRTAVRASTSKVKSVQRKKPAASKITKETTKIQYNQRKFGDSLWDEILLIMLIIFSILIIISLFSSSMGFLGGIISSLFKGLLGIGGVIFPFIVIIYSLWLLISDDTDSAPLKIVASAIFLVTLSVLFHYINGDTTINSILELYKEGTVKNGGAIGGAIGNGLQKILGNGKYIVVFTFMVIAIIVGTGKSLINGVSDIISYIDVSEKKRSIKLKARAEMIHIEEEEQRKKAERMARKNASKNYYEQGNEIKRTKQKRGYFNIKLADEQVNPKSDDIPVIEVPKLKPKKEEIPKKETPFYDYSKIVSQEYDEDDDGYIPIISTSNIFIEDELDKTIDEINNEDKKQALNKKNSSPKISFSTKNTDIKEPVLITERFKDDKEELQPEVMNLIAEELYGENLNIDTENKKDKITDIIKDVSEGKVIDADKNAVIEAELKNENKPFENTVKSEEVLHTPKTENIVLSEKYEFPSIELLGKSGIASGQSSREEMLKSAKKLEETLKSFGVEARVVQINSGPTVTRYELSPNQGVKVSKIVNLADDIALNLAASGIRIEAPIPGKAAVGIEVPNKEAQSVYLRDVIDSEIFKGFKSKLTFALGKDISGSPVVSDISKMPHLLIAGATGSGKSVCINTLIMSILYKAEPNEVKLLMIDPKVVELSVYNGIPHLLIPVVTDPKKAAGALNWAVREMDSRYNVFAEHNARNIDAYNNIKKEKGKKDFMPKIVIIIDELADLMMTAAGDVEEAICRLAQKARAAGIHLIIATQRPSVDVITGVIKANIPSRLAFAVSSGTDSRTILDMVGAEKLLGKGDMLFYPAGIPKPIRLQGAFITDKEVENIVDFVKKGKEHVYDQSIVDKITSPQQASESSNDLDEFFDKAIDLVVEKGKASVSMLQRQFRIGYNRAARIMEELEERGIVGNEEGSKPRKVLLSKEELYQYRQD